MQMVEIYIKTLILKGLKGDIMKICYMEDCMGGFCCLEKDKDYWINEYHHKATCCFTGNRKEVENYLGTKIKVLYARNKLIDIDELC